MAIHWQSETKRPVTEHKGIRQNHYHQRYKSANKFTVNQLINPKWIWTRTRKKNRCKIMLFIDRDFIVNFRKSGSLQFFGAQSIEIGCVAMFKLQVTLSFIMKTIQLDKYCWRSIEIISLSWGSKCISFELLWEFCIDCETSYGRWPLQTK